MNLKIKNYWGIIFGLIILLIDQTSKFLIIKKIPDSGIFLWQNKVFSANLSLAQNKNFAFSFGFGNNISIIISLVILLILFQLAYQKFKAKQYTIANFIIIVLLIGCSNFADRFFYGGVIDFIQIKIFNYNWPIFNLADIFITLITIGLIYKIFKPKTKYEKNII